MTYDTFIILLSLICVSCGTAALVLDYLVGGFRRDFAIPCLLCIGVGVLGLVVTI